MKGRIVIEFDPDKGGVGIGADWIENGRTFKKLGPLEALAVIEQARILILGSADLKPPLAISVVPGGAMEQLKELDA